MGQGLQARALEALQAGPPREKAGLVRALLADWDAGRLEGPMGGAGGEVVPGYPPGLEVVAPRDLKRRGGREGQRALFHAVAHIEFSAINLALDAVYRFPGLPFGFYRDWLRVAAEEVSHFELIEAHLGRLGARYGDLPAHASLWEMACATAADPLERMALVPRYLEARGLDVNPGMQARLRALGDSEGVAILEVILRDEIGHVARGDAWFRHLCGLRGWEPEGTYQRLVRRHIPHPWRGPLHCEARRQAGFSEAELREFGCG